MEDEKLNKFVLEKPTVKEGGGICAIKDSNVTVEIICKAVPRHRGKVERNLLRKIKDEFQREKIKLL